MSEETSTSGLLSITKLSGSEGYANWAFRVKNSLKYKKLWKCVLGEKSGDPDADDQALSIISLACNDIVKDDIIECTSAKEAWEILAAKFVRKTPAAKVSLYCALTSLKCSDLAGVRELLNQFQVIVRKLKELKVEMDDDMYSIVLLKALPESFEQFKVAIMTRDELPSLDEIKSKVEEETHRQLQQVPPHQEEQVEQALMTRRPISRGRCYGCGEQGHYQRDCRRNDQRERRPNYRPRQREQSRHRTFQQRDNRKPRDAYYARSMTAVSEINDPHRWIVDSGSTAHICKDRQLFTEMRSHSEGIKSADGSITQCDGIGTVELETADRIMVIRDVLFVPSFDCNLFSVSRADQRGYKVSFSKSSCEISSGSVILARGSRRNDQYCLDVLSGRVDRQRVEEPCEAMSINTESRSHTLMQWHRRLGHLNCDTILRMAKSGAVRGLDITSTRREQCEVCARCKIAEEPYPKAASRRSSHILERIHSDVCEMPQLSFGGAKYFVTFIDDCSRFVKVECLRSKSDVFDAWQRFQRTLERQTGRQVKILRSDNGGEFTSSRFEAQLASCGIVHETSVPHSPAQNGVAERMNRTLTEMVRAMLLDGHLPGAAWAEALHAAVYVRNRAISAGAEKTPFELIYGRAPQMGHLERVGAKVVSMKRTGYNKLSPKGDVMRMCGYSTRQKGYRLLNPLTGQITISRNCRFLDEQLIDIPEEADEQQNETAESPPEKQDDEFLDCEELPEPRQRYERAAKVPVNYREAESDEGW